jgi:hypothetical protein
VTTPLIRSRVDAGLRDPRRVVRHQYGDDDQAVVSVHHTAGPSGQPWTQIQDAAMDGQGLDDAHYSWGVEDDDRPILQTLRGDDVVVQADGVNWDVAAAIVFRGTFTTRLPRDGALHAAAWKIAERSRALGRPRLVAGNPPAEVNGRHTPPAQRRRRRDTLYIVHHADRMATSCPGAQLIDYRPQLIARVRALLEGDDMATPAELWGHQMVSRVSGNTVSARDVLLATQVRADRALAVARDQLAGQAAILAAVTGQDQTAAIRAELDRHRDLLLGELGDDFADGLVERLTDVPAETVRAAVREELAARDRRAAGVE